MNLFFKTLRAALAAMLLLSVLAVCGCSADKPDPPKEPLTILSAGECRYTVIRPEAAGKEVVSAARALKQALAEVSGGAVELKSDALYGAAQPEGYEILVGQTNRAESVKALDSLRYDDYIVSIEGEKLVINSQSEHGLAEAVNYVIGLLKESGGEFVFAEEDEMLFTVSYPYEDVTVGGHSLKGYTLVIPEDADPIVADSASSLRDAITKACGIRLPLVFDSEEESENEILIGETAREASKTIEKESLGKYGYEVSESGSKIVIGVSENELAWKKAFEALEKELEKGCLPMERKQIELSNEPVLSSFFFTDIHNNFAMLEPTNDTGDYVIRKNVDAMIDHLLATEGKVDVVQVGGDLMSDYHEWYKSGCWPYAYFVEYRQRLVDTFNRLAKDGKVLYTAGNHDYAQGELATDGPGLNGSYNSFDFYFGDVGMRQGIGELAQEDMFVKLGEKTGEKYLLAYYYEVNGIGFAGLSPDHDKIWAKQGEGFDAASLEWLDKKLDEVDPHGNKVIFVSCHYNLDLRLEIEASGRNVYANESRVVRDALQPIFRGHKNLYHLFGHYEIWFSDSTARYMSHHNKSGKVIDVTGKETESTQVVAYADRDFTSVYGGTFRPTGGYSDWFEKDSVTGYAGLSKYGHKHHTTGTPRVGQGLYIEVYEDRIEFTMKNIGDAEGFATTDLITPYTVWLYE